MDKLIPTTAYTPVDVKDRLPEIDKDVPNTSMYVCGIDSGGRMYDCWYDFEKNIWKDNMGEVNIAHWLEPKANSIVLTPEQFEKIAKGIWDAGAEHLRDIANHNSTPNFEQYFKSLFD